MASGSSPPLPTLLDLPPNVVDKILTRLPIRDAVLTGALSRPWRHRWKSIPDLQFLDRQLPPAAIDAVLSLHSAPILRFSLITDHSDHAGRWLISLSHHGGAHSLYLSFIQRPPRYPLPPSAFSFHKTLTHLHLANCSIDPPPPPTADFPSLLTLSLMHVEFPDNDGQQLSLLLSRCPVLEELSLFLVRQGGRLRIRNRNLRCFRFCGDCEVITLTGGMTLRNISIFLHDSWADMSIADLFRDAVCNGFLSLCNSTVEALAKSSIPESIPTGFQHLRTLHMELNLADTKHITLMLCLLTRAPNLQELCLFGPSYKGLRDNEDDSGPGEEFWKAQHSSDLFANLRTVKVVDTVFAQPEMEFMQFILARARLLETLITINFHEDEATTNYELAHIELAKSHKASNQAQILHKQTRMDMNMNALTQ